MTKRLTRAPVASAAYAAIFQALCADPTNADLQHALGDARMNVAAAQFVDHTDPLGSDDPLPDALCPPCRCLRTGPVPRFAATDAWRNRVERGQRRSWEQLAARHNVPIEDFLAQVTRRMQRVVSASTLYVRVPSDLLPTIIEAGRLGTESDAGQYAAGCLAVRQQTAYHVYGDCPQHTTSEQRHIFAYLATPAQRTRLASRSRRLFGMDRLGDVDLELSPRVRARATITFGPLADVTDCGFRPGCCPDPLTALTHLAYPVHVADRGFGWSGWETTYQTSDPLAPGAVSPLRHVLQAQVRGPVTLADITNALPAVPDFAAWPELFAFRRHQAA